MDVSFWSGLFATVVPCLEPRTLNTLHFYRDEALPLNLDHSCEYVVAEHLEGSVADSSAPAA